MSTRDLIKDLIQRLYDESIRNGYSFTISQYDTSGQNRLSAEDGTFLGTLGSKYDNQSIFNSYGPYGSKYSATSIFNQYSPYGSKYSAQSPVNRFASTPPQVFISGNYFGRLTANKYIHDAVPVDVFLFYVLSQMGLLDEKLDDLIDLISRI
jgi:hypothetical protein